jgi:hypothetical protein
VARGLTFIRIQILEVFPSKNPIKATMNSPKETKAVRRITNLRLIGCLTAYKRRKVQPIINDTPIPMISLICKSGLKSGLPVRMPNT